MAEGHKPDPVAISPSVRPVKMDRRQALAITAAVGLCFAVALAGLVAIGPLARPGPPVALGAPTFVAEGSGAGLDHTYGGDFAYSVGGGVAVLDCNADGKPDLYLAGGQGTAALFRNESPTGRALRFARVPGSSTDLPSVTGAYPIDIDSDGITDLVLLRSGENVLLRGLGGCGFARANEALGFSGGNSATTAFSATWEAGARLPTLAFGNYVDPRSNDPHRLCFDNELIRPAPSGVGYATAIPLTPSWCALSMLFSDWNRSGRMDLRVSNDRHYYLVSEGQEQLWRVRPGAAPSLYTADDGWVATQVEGMGIASYDVTGDGYPEVFLTSQGDNRLQTLALGPSKPMYRDIGAKRGVNAAQPFTGGDTRPSTAWHDEFADVNNDGLVDLFIAKGNVTTDPGYAQRDPSNLLLGQPDGTFREAAEAAGIVSFDRGRGAALADFNRDGLLDLIQMNYGAPVRLWRNVGTGSAERPQAMGNWIALRLTQPAPNVDAVGAWVEVRIGDRVMSREQTVGGGHAGGQLGWIHFGLGQASGADVRVVWPNGETGPWQQVAANGTFTLTRGVDGVR